MNLAQKLIRLSRYTETGRLIIPEIRTGSILDAGCGENLYKIINNTIVGVDLTSEYADIQADVSNLPIESNYFDKALCFGVFSEDVTDCQNQLNESTRVVKPNGVIFIRCVIGHPIITMMNNYPVYKEPATIQNNYTEGLRFFAAYYNNK